MHLFLLSAFFLLAIHSVQATEIDPFDINVLEPMLKKQEITQEQADIWKKEVVEVRKSLSNPEQSAEDLDRFWDFVDQISPCSGFKLK